jgi:hypothetical protein
MWAMIPMFRVRASGTSRTGTLSPPRAFWGVA